MAPPELARDAPVLDVVHPLVVVLTQFSGTKLTWPPHRLDGRAFWAINMPVASGPVCSLGDEPPVGQHGTDDPAGAVAAANHPGGAFVSATSSPQRLEVGPSTAGPRSPEAVHRKPGGGRALSLTAGTAPRER